jgi:hypothetical protein
VRETLLNTDLAGEGGQRLKKAAEDASKVPEIAARVAAICARKPWGTDHYGAACDEALSSIGTVLGKLDKHVEAVGTFGANIVKGVADTVAADMDARDSIIASRDSTVAAALGSALQE